MSDGHSDRGEQNALPFVIERGNMPAIKTNNVVVFFSTLIASLRLESEVLTVAEDLRSMRRQQTEVQINKTLAKAGLSASQVASVLVCAGLCDHARAGQESYAVQLFRHAVENTVTPLQAKAATELATAKKSVDFRKLVSLIVNGAKTSTAPRTWDQKTDTFCDGLNKSGAMLGDQSFAKLEAQFIKQREMRALAHVYA